MQANRAAPSKPSSALPLACHCCAKHVGGACRQLHRVCRKGIVGEVGKVLPRVFTGCHLEQPCHRRVRGAAVAHAWHEELGGDCHCGACRSAAHGGLQQLQAALHCVKGGGACARVQPQVGTAAQLPAQAVPHGATAGCCRLGLPSHSAACLPQDIVDPLSRLSPGSSSSGCFGCRLPTAATNRLEQHPANVQAACGSLRRPQAIAAGHRAVGGAAHNSCAGGPAGMLAAAGRGVHSECLQASRHPGDRGVAAGLQCRTNLEAGR